MDASGRHGSRALLKRWAFAPHLVRGVMLSRYVTLSAAVVTLLVFCAACPAGAATTASSRWANLAFSHLVAFSPATGSLASTVTVSGTGFRAYRAVEIGPGGDVALSPAAWGRGNAM